MSGILIMQPLYISLFGGIAVRDGTGRSLALTGRKDRALLGFLAASAGVPWPRDKLAALLWGDTAEGRARDSLKQSLLRLRRRLGASPPLNLWIRTAPRGAESFCWRVDILPRLTHLAGLELGTGVNLCVVAPEVAAQELRDV